MRFPLLTLILVMLSSGSPAQDQFKAAFWNVENLFDTTNAAQSRDEDFTPSGRYAWTEDLLQKKFNSLTRVINDIDKGDDLAILGLAEIENKQVLKRLNDEYLQKGWKIVHQESPDERGIDCAVLYDPELVKLKDYKFLTVFLAGDDKTRDIVEAEFVPRKGRVQNSFYVFVNHWPSRWGGQEKTDPLRRTAARTLRARIDDILVKQPNADILIMGDLNDYPNDPSVYEVLRAHEPGPIAYPGDLINTTWKLHADPHAGTYMYRGDWNVLDQVIISVGMQDKHGFDWVLNSTSAFKPEYLIEKDGKYAGWPFRMFRSGKYHGGYSDHLPVVCSITVNP